MSHDEGNSSLYEQLTAKSFSGIIFHLSGAMTRLFNPTYYDNCSLDVLDCARVQMIKIAAKSDDLIAYSDQLQCGFNIRITKKDTISCN